MQRMIYVLFVKPQYGETKPLRAFEDEQAAQQAKEMIEACRPAYPPELFPVVLMPATPETLVADLPTPQRVPVPFFDRGD